MDATLQAREAVSDAHQQVQDKVMQLRGLQHQLSLHREARESKDADIVAPETPPEVLAARAVQIQQEIAVALQSTEAAVQNVGLAMGVRAMVVTASCCCLIDVLWEGGPYMLVGISDICDHQASYAGGSPGSHGRPAHIRDMTGTTALLLRASI